MAEREVQISLVPESDAHEEQASLLRPRARAQKILPAADILRASELAVVSATDLELHALRSPKNKDAVAQFYERQVMLGRILK